MDAYWQIIYRNTTAEQSLHVSSIYHDCCWKYINSIIVYRFSRRDKGISIYTSYLKYYFLSKSIIDFWIIAFTIFFVFQETKCLLLSYFILLFLMFVVLLVGGVIAYVFRHQVKSDIMSLLYRAFHITVWTHCGSNTFLSKVFSISYLFHN